MVKTVSSLNNAIVFGDGSSLTVVAGVKKFLTFVVCLVAFRKTIYWWAMSWAIKIKAASTL